MAQSWKDVNAIYQIYPRSFQDGNGDGIGDLRGATERLSYLKGGASSLGVDAIWFSPFYPSPMADFGYDVSDYCGIDPQFGTLQDFDNLVAHAHSRRIKVMIDFVPNHSSNQHPWFLESQHSKDSDKRDYYVWRDPKHDGSPPNNWLSIFGGSAWEWHEPTGQYYLHTFLKEQPDLNWDNPAVRTEMQAVLRFWFDRGVDGIRADAVRWISKDVKYRDDPKNLAYIDGQGDPFDSLLHVRSRYGEKLFDYLREMTDVVAEYDERIMIFEDYPDSVYTTRDQYLGFYGVNPKVSMPFNFEGIGLPFSAAAYREFITEFQGFLNPAEHTPVYCFGNHDQPRLVSRVGDEQARLVALMQMMLPGLPVVYYGDELGMVNGVIPLEDEQDPLNRIKPGLGLGRDPERTPMQWDGTKTAGFTVGEPWLPVAEIAATRNVDAEQVDPDSYLTLYRELLQFRGSQPVLRHGDYETFGEANPYVFVFSRRLQDEHVFVALNFSAQPQEVALPHAGAVLYGTHPADLPKIGHHGQLQLRAYEGAVVVCAKHPLKTL